MISFLNNVVTPLIYVGVFQKEGTAIDCATVELLETCQSKEERNAISGVAATGYVGKDLQCKRRMLYFTYPFEPLAGSDTVCSSWNLDHWT